MESLEQIQGMPPGMYHRYGVLDDDMEDEDDENAEHAGDFSNGAANSGPAGSAGIYSADMLVAGMAGLGVHDPAEPEVSLGSAGEEGETADSSGAAGQGNWSLLAHPGELSPWLGCARIHPGDADSTAANVVQGQMLDCLAATVQDNAPCWHQLFLLNLEFGVTAASHPAGAATWHLLPCIFL